LTANIYDTIRNPIGLQNHFRGNFNGNNYKLTLGINNTTLTILRLGLFSFIEDAEIHNLIVDGYVNSSGIQSYTGGFFGQTASSTLQIIGTCIISNCINFANLSGSAVGHIGGIGGTIFSRNGDSVINCINAGNITFNSIQLGYIGGIVGGAYYESQIINCLNLGKVFCISFSTPNGDYNRVGGICGFLSSSHITKCINSALVISSYTGTIGGVGGLVGLAQSGSSITDCINTGAVEGSEKKDCILGNGSSYTITNC